MKALRAARLNTELRPLALMVLRRLCGRIGHLPDSYLLFDKLDVSGMPYASGGFADVRKGVFKGKDVAVKSVRVSEMGDKVKIRKVGKQSFLHIQGRLHVVQRVCKEVAMWKNLSHPNVFNLIGVPDIFEDGKFSVVSEWMANGNIMEYVGRNSGNHLKLVCYNRIFPCRSLNTFQLADIAEGLGYLHNVKIVHGDLKGVSLSVTISWTRLTRLFRPISSSRTEPPSQHVSRTSGS